MSGLFQELKRRNVFRVGIAYLVASWLLLQVLDVVGPILRLPEEFGRYLLFLLVIGLVPALIFAWLYEMTPEGVRRESDIDRNHSITPQTGKKLDRMIIIALGLAVVVLLTDKLFLSDRVDEGLPGQTAVETVSDGRPLSEVPMPSPSTRTNSVVVLPFVAMSNGPDDDYFSDGLTEEIINALAQVPGLLVTARTSAFHFKDKNLPVADIARQLGVAHVVDGSVRRAGDRLRITAQLIRAEDGFNLWSETYDRRSSEPFAVQADIAEKVTQALDVYLDENMRRSIQIVGTRNVDAFIAFQKGFELYDRAHEESNQISLLRRANVEFERALELAPGFYPAIELHSDLYTHILISNAAGELDGNITQADLDGAPMALRRDYEQGLALARNAAERRNSEFGLALLFGPWQGLASLGARAAAPPGCVVDIWLHLLAPFPGQTAAIRDAFDRMAACDPILVRPLVHRAGLRLLLGATGEVVRMVRSDLGQVDAPNLTRNLVLALAANGDFDAAQIEATSRIRHDGIRLQILSQLAAMQGDEVTAEEIQADFLARHGPNDRDSLVLEAVRGNRNEANRLAGLIDARPFGHMALLQAIGFCMCGAPFDLEAAPGFAALLEPSGLAWPPLRPLDYPLKSW
jgi:TolB-like protein